MNWHPKRCVVVGAGGGIGAEFVRALSELPSVEQVYACSRSTGDDFQSSMVESIQLDFDYPESILSAAQRVHANGDVDLVLVATGLLHERDGMSPEKGLRDLNFQHMMRSYQVNTIGPALIAQSFLPLLVKERKSVFAALSARIGSISDNRIGGWYSYRAAKSALNQVLRTASIEHRRRWKHSVVIGLHPGTVDTDLSKPFQRNVPIDKLFSASKSVEQMLQVIDRIRPEDTGKFLAYDGSEISY